MFFFGKYGPVFYSTLFLFGGIFADFNLLVFNQILIITIVYEPRPIQISSRIVLQIY